MGNREVHRGVRNCFLREERNEDLLGIVGDECCDGRELDLNSTEVGERRNRRNRFIRVHLLRDQVARDRFANAGDALVLVRVGDLREFVGVIQGEHVQLIEEDFDSQWVVEIRGHHGVGWTRHGCRYAEIAHRIESVDREGRGRHEMIDPFGAHIHAIVDGAREHVAVHEKR